MACLFALASSAAAYDMSNWSDKTICRLIDEKHSSLLTQLLQEKRTRRLICNNGKIAGYTLPKVASSEPTSNTESSEDNDYICLSCGVGSTSSTPIKTSTAPVCSLNYMSACDSEDICNRATQHATPKWRKKNDTLYQYVVEAKKRGLSCGVEVSSSTLVESESNNFVCRRATNMMSGTKAWHKSSHSFYKYVVEAKKRGLSCGVESTSSAQGGETTVSSDLPKCPSDINALWHNCFGTETAGKYKDTYVGDWKNGKKHGQGTLTFNRGHDWAGGKYIGGWKDGKEHGQGVFTYNQQADDDEFAVVQYIGEFKYGQWNGQGAMTYANGSVDEGVWLYGEFQYAKSPTTTSSSTCSWHNLSVCTDDLVCQRGSRIINGKRLWGERSPWIKYSVEAKKRGLSCGVGSSSSTTTSSSACSLNNLNACINDVVCANASIKINGVRKWEERPRYFKYVVEAKKRGLSCGVCSLDNLNVCSSDLVCQRGSRLFNGKRIWDERSAWIKYSVEAKKRGLSCGTSSTSAEPKSVSDLSNCPSNKKVRWNNCFGSYAYDNGNKYVGEWKDNQKTGQGTYTWKSGDIYVGEFKDDKSNGQGVLTYGSGDKYIGEFKNDSFYGQGTYTFKDGRVEEGNWKDGKLNGLGIVTYINGDMYVGEFKDDKMTKGTFTFGQQSDWAGDKYVGEYRDGKRHGQGTYTFADGTVKKGTWKDGELQSLEPAPVVPNKQPEAPTETASSLNDPLHIKIYGKTLHTLLLPNTLLFIGEIEDGDERGFRTALRAHEVDTVVLLSGGGLVSEGLRIANIINDKSLTTYVPVDATCASACSFMFFAGNPKVAHGRLGVHQFYVDDDEKKASIGKVQKGTQLLVADIIQNLTDFGTPASVFPKMFSTSGMYFFSETEKSAFSDRNKITPETVTRINEALSYLIKEFDNELDDAVLDGMPQKTKSTLIQLELIRIGCMEGPVDGIRGEATKSAIDLLSSKMKSKLSSNKFSDLFRRLNNTKVGACY